MRSDMPLWVMLGLAAVTIACLIGLATGWAR